MSVFYTLYPVGGSPCKQYEHFLEGRYRLCAYIEHAFSFICKMEIYRIIFHRFFKELCTKQITWSS